VSNTTLFFVFSGKFIEIKSQKVIENVLKHPYPFIMKNHGKLLARKCLKIIFHTGSKPNLGALSE